MGRRARLGWAWAAVAFATAAHGEEDVDLQRLYDLSFELSTAVTLEVSQITDRGAKPPHRTELALPDTALSVMIEHAWSLPSTDDSYSAEFEIQIEVLKLTAESMKKLSSWTRTGTADVHWDAVQTARAMLSAAQASVPVCRESEVCIVDKMTMMLWRYANAGAEELLNAGLEWPLWARLRPFLPWSARWQTPWQCPTLLWPGLAARPMWQLEELPEDSAAYRLFVALRDNAQEVAEELRGGVRSGAARALLKSPAWPGLAQGSWQAFSLFRSEGFFGRQLFQRQLDPLRCKLTPRTCEIMRQAGAPPGMVHGLPSVQSSQEVVDFLSAEPGTDIHFHAASSNSRLTVQMCLAGCNGDSEDTYIQAGPMRSHYRFGEPIVFDDSFLHRIHVDPNSKETRWTLTVQLLHPNIDSVERFAQYFAFLPGSPKASDPRDAAEEGGPLPPPLGYKDVDTGGAFSYEEMTFQNHLDDAVHVWAAMYGPDKDGPPMLICEVDPKMYTPYSLSTPLALPRDALSHRARLSATSAKDGKELKVWRVDARAGGQRSFVLSPPPPEGKE